MDTQIRRIVFLIIFLGVTACTSHEGIRPTASLYYPPYSTLTPVTPSVTVPPPTLTATIPVPTDAPTLTPEPDIAPECTIVNSEGKIYLLSDEVFFAFGPTEEKIDRVLADNYPEWASYEQNVPWDTKPVKLGEIVSAASSDDRFNLNPAVVLVVLGESLSWQIPPDNDLFSPSRLISERLADFAFAWGKLGNEQIHARYPEVPNSATYALYAFFDYDKEKLQVWCNIYQNLFGVPIPYIR